MIDVSFTIEMNVCLEDLVKAEAKKMLKYGLLSEHRRLPEAADYREFVDDRLPEAADYREFVNERLTEDVCFDIISWFLDGLYFPSLKSSCLLTYTFSVGSCGDIDSLKRSVAQVTTLNGFVYWAYSFGTSIPYVIDNNVSNTAAIRSPDEAALLLLMRFIERDHVHKLKCSLVEKPELARPYEHSYPVLHISRG